MAWLHEDGAVVEQVKGSALHILRGLRSGLDGCGSAKVDITAGAR